MRSIIIIAIFVASVLDAVLTDFGIRLGSIAEFNPLMRELYNWNEPAFFFLKIALPLSLLLIIPKSVSKPIRHLLIVTAGIYLCVLSLHGVWLVNQFILT